MIPQNANTKITGINTLNEFATAGGILSPNLICNLSICEIVINNSHVIRPMMIPAKSPVVPILLNPKIPVTESPFSAPTGVTSNTFGIITIKLDSAMIAAANGFSNRLLCDNI